MAQPDPELPGLTAASDTPADAATTDGGDVGAVLTEIRLEENGEAVDEDSRGDADGDSEEDTDGDSNDDIDSDAISGCEEDPQDVYEEADHPEEDKKVPAIPTKVNDIPGIIEKFGSSEEELWNEASDKLVGIMNLEPELFLEHVIPKTPYFLDVAKKINADHRRSSILGFIGSFPTLFPSARALLISNINDLVPFLCNSDAMDQHYTLNILEDLAEEEPTSKPLILECLQAVFTLRPDYHGVTSHEMEAAASAIAAFESTLLWGRGQCKKLFVQAGAVAYALSTISAPSKSLRRAGQSCMQQLFNADSELDDESSKVEGRSDLRGNIVRAFIQSLKDEDLEVAGAAAEFFQGDGGDQAKPIFLKDPIAMIPLMLLLAKKPPKLVGVSCEWALMKYTDGETADAVVSAFRSIWEDGDILTETKFKIIVGLADSFVDLRLAALKGGLCEFLLGLTGDGERQIEAMTVLDRLMEEEQKVGFFLLKTDAINQILTVLNEPSSAGMKLAGSILSRLLDSYSTGEESVSLRSTVTAALVSSNSLPRVVSALYADDPTTANAAAKLLAEILAEESGTESWGYEEESGNPPPPSTNKDAIVTPDLVDRSISLLTKPTCAAGALNLLCQCCWGYPRGLDLVQQGFQPYIPNADVFFFASLYGQYSSRHAGRQRRRVAEAAVRAGALPRAVALLEAEAETVEARRAAVEGYRVLLAADSADKNVAIKSARLPVVLAALIADETSESLMGVHWMLRLLYDEENPTTFVAWTELSTPETIQHFINILNTVPEPLDGPVEEGMTEEEFANAQAEYEGVVAKREKENNLMINILVELLDKLVPLLVPQAGKLLGPLLVRSTTLFDNSALLQLLNKLAASEIDIASKESLVASVRHILERPLPPDLINIQSWLCNGSTLTDAFYAGGLAGKLLENFNPTEGEEENENESDQRQALSLLSTLADRLEDKTSIAGLQSAFFAHPIALKAALDIVKYKDEDGIWAAFSAASDLAPLVEGYPEGLAILKKEDAFSAALKLFDHQDASADTVSPLVGILCEADPAKLAEMVRSHIAQLRAPQETANAPVPTGKKKKKKKNFSPRINETEVWGRIKALVKTTPSARRALVDGGAVEDAKRILNQTSPGEELLTHAFELIEGLVKVDEGYADLVSDVLPKMAELISSESEPLSPNLQVIKALLPKHIGLLVASGIHLSLVKGLCRFPTSFGDITMLIDAVYVIASSKEGRSAVCEALRASLADEDADAQEEIWGNSHGLRRLILEGEAGAVVVLEAGGVEYAIKLLQSENIKLAVKGGALSTTLARSEAITAIPILIENDVMSLVEVGRAKASAFAQETFTTEEEDEHAIQEAKNVFDERVRLMESYVQKFSWFSKILSGERVQDFEEDLFI